MIGLMIGLNLVNFVLTQGVLKTISNKLNIPKALCVQYLGAALIITVYNLIFGNLSFKPEFLFICVVGFFQVFGAYFQWKAYKSSLSKTILFVPFSGVITVFLAAIIIGESSIYSSGLIAGSVVLFLSAVLLNKRDPKENEKTNAKWLVYTIGMVLISGVATFMIKFFTLEDTPRSLFLFYWYVSSFLASAFILWLRINESGVLIHKRALLIPLASVGILTNIATIHWLFTISDVGVMQPILQFSTGALTLLLGWFLFKEIKGIKKVHILGFALGVVGAGLVIFAQ